jgi:hypothetical protein
MIPLNLVCKLNYRNVENIKVQFYLITLNQSAFGVFNSSYHFLKLKLRMVVFNAELKLLGNESSKKLIHIFHQELYSIIKFSWFPCSWKSSFKLFRFKKLS